MSQRLCTRIVNEIEQHGPIGLDHYMRMALYEPGLGYYSNGLLKFGADGDFVTAPEQGRLFAKSLAGIVMVVANRLNTGFDVLELGPGSGVLARDLLMTLNPLPERYLMLETSATLRQVQQETLAALPAPVAQRVEWIDQPPASGFSGVIVGNEVIDALPVCSFEVQADGLMERAVALDASRFGWQLRPPSDRLASAYQKLSTDLDEPLPNGYCSEICVDLPDWFGSVTQSLDQGLVLMIDYGYPRREYYHPDRTEGTLVCHYRHRAHFDPLAWPGLNDISAFVDFTAVAETAQQCGLEIEGFTSQAGFVVGSGVGDTLEQIADESERLRLSGEFKRLVLPGEMGEKFKVMALVREIGGKPALSPVAFALSDQMGRL